MEQKMNQKDSFEDLSLCKIPSKKESFSRGNIIKSSAIVLNSNKETSESGANTEPDIIIHQIGAKIDSIEFRCPCGNSTEVKLEYDGD